ncbi:hypothetical protein bcgnr5379_60470 [Bacillus cereus]|uniref:Uncharacterized protein n=1 Tax=Lysobacter enzymogenes TaxID=69 RepID=A0AAU9AFJ0_LYSEN|nr:hypothetical protein [Lysobacter enzymogenes]BAV97957.1 hypothetical protein LEN_2470 [Lysobacter enzymogenes]
MQFASLVHAAGCLTRDRYEHRFPLSRVELERALDRLDGIAQARIKDLPERTVFEVEFEDAIIRLLEHANTSDYGYPNGR